MKYSDTEKAERLLKGYCPECFEPLDAHSDSCPVYFENMFAKTLREEIDRDILSKMIEIVKNQEDRHGSK